jgi:DNA replication protein DnaC
MEMDVQAAQAQDSGIPQIVTAKSVCCDFVADIAAREAALSPEQRAERERREAERKAERLEHEQRQSAEQRRDFISQFGVRYADCTLDNFVMTCPEQQKVLDSLRDYGLNFPDHYKKGEGVIFFGPPGTGKDHLAAGLAIRLYDYYPCRQRQFFRFITGLEMYQEVRDVMRRKGVTEWDVMQPWFDASLLILSDPLPPRGPLTDWQAGVLLQVIDARYRSKSPTIVTLNIANGTEGDERMGAQTMDRLKDGSLCLFCNWPSHRKALEGK